MFQTGSMTAASALMGVTQPAVSRLVRDFESEIKIPLFDRKGGRISATPDAVTLYQEVQRSLYSGMREILLSDLRDCLDYDPVTGVLTWKDRPLHHFASASYRDRFNRRYAGRAARARHSAGYRQLCLAIGGVEFRLFNHRAAWALMTGSWPDPEVDHRDGDGRNNRWSNLREATRGEQLGNTILRTDNASGYMGVSWSCTAKKWWAQIKVDGIHYNLGYYPTAELAYEKYLEARAVLRPHQPVPRAA